jgi:ubiquinone/menaquinone biosynthesis C-methylase UbiE
MLQDDYRQKYKKLNPHWEDSISIYRSFVKKYISSDTVVLEAGCGFSNMFVEEYKKARKIIGVDVNKEFLEKNPVIQEKIVANIEDMLQIKDGSIDLIISSWVFEHLQHPDKAFAEFNRVLKKSGRIVFITPNVWNYVIVLNRLIPKWLRKFVVGRISEDLVTDPMPAFYKANSPLKIQELAKSNELEIEDLKINGDPTYVAINNIFFYMGVIIDAFLGLPLFRQGKVHLIGVMKKK